MARARLLELATASLVEQLDGLGPLSLARDESVTHALALLGQLRRTVDAVGAALGGEVARRSEIAETSLARRLGERSAGVAVARLTGIDVTEANDWCVAGAASAGSMSLAGVPLPARYPATAESLREAVLTPRAARSIIETLDAVASRATPDDVVEVEQFLLSHAPRLTGRELAKLCRAVIDRYDPDGAEPREERLRARSGIKVIAGHDGLTTWIMTMHPEAAALLTAAVDARIAPRRVAFLPVVGDADFDPVLADDRTTPQKRLDALTDIARESLAHDTGKLAGTAVTLNVTMPLESLLTGIGVAHIDGVDEPISASTARRMAADASIIPVVLGGHSEPLDVGRARRLYTEPQRRALAIRDGGCIWNCGAPPGWCEVAHVTPWSERGPTDLSNGALMCRFHHRRFDNDGWQLEWRDGIPWLIPPAWVDPTQTPRRAGRLPRAA